MAFILDPVNALGLTFNIIIVVLGYWSYKKSGDKVPLYVSMAFVLFGISYIITLFGLGRTLESVLIIRTLGYLILTFAVYKLAFKR
ncbi:MAG: hypothetical protein O8C64_11315 [Candidatus Methanoperedens sp.]|nr:hypothetical protein [Candidatus Methanoperedens sp.]